MHIIVSTPKGRLYDEEVDYIVVKNDEGEYAIMKNHIPDMCIIPEGYVKLIRGNLEYYIVTVNAVLEYRDLQANVLAQEAHIGESLQDAKDSIEGIRKDRLEKNRETAVNMLESEKDLVKNVKESKAGRL